MRSASGTLSLLFLLPAALWAPDRSIAQTPGLALELEAAFDGLSRPIDLTNAGDGSGRIFIAEQNGRILLSNGFGSPLSPTPFLDIGSKVACCGEGGLLGLTFHPDYETNGFFYVYYTTSPPTDPADVVDSVVARYSVSSGNPNVANATSELILLRTGQPFGNHNGGRISFGPDGYLYVALGDGGSGGDPQNHGQDTSTLLGSLLRIDVDQTDPGRQYAIPGDNPLAQDAPPGCPDSCVGPPCGTTCDEIWAYGLRNPWRFSFDRLNGDVFIGDVGQAAIEEIDFQPSGSSGGENYGWRRMEGTTCFNPATNCDTGSLTHPILEYSHTEGCSVTGGYRYGGDLEPSLKGVYLFGDFCSGTVWGTVPRCDGVWERRALLQSGRNILTFGEDEAGEIYLAGFGGGGPDVFRLRVTAAADGPLLDPSPGALDFGVHLPNELSTLGVTISNDNAGPEALAVSDFAASDPVRFSLDLAAGANPCGAAPFCLPPGGSCTFEVDFSSSTEGIFAEAVTFDANSAVDSIPLAAVARLPCTFSDTLTVSAQDIATPESFNACETIDVGPDVAVTTGGEATFRAGNVVAFRNGFTVDGGQLSVVIDPILAID